LFLVLLWCRGGKEGGEGPTRAKQGWNTTYNKMTKDKTISRARRMIGRIYKTIAQLSHRAYIYCPVCAWGNDIIGLTMHDKK
jgi:hypothetical protein